MNTPNRWITGLAVLATAWSLVACGGGGTSVAPSPAPLAAAPEAGAPASVGNVAIDGRNWINFRRTKIGIPVMTPNNLVDRAAQAHSDYQKLNNVVTHEEVTGKPGFTGVTLLDRLQTAGYFFNKNNDYAYGEVISATSNSSGAYMAEELITAIYHRFVIFEPMFKEIGSGSATTDKGYTYFTSDFTANNGYGPGIGLGAMVNWPYNGQAGVAPNFFSDNESPDPVAGVNEVGYPVSVHADITATVTVQSFTIRPRGGAVLPVKLLQQGTDKDTPKSAAAIVPLAVLKAATIYDVTFVGTADAVPVTKSWSFTTK
jgi:uncharacterized protein YkwD